MVIDADTKTPIEGAVVVGTWNETRAWLNGPMGRLKDVRETLTDDSGVWTIRGPRGSNQGTFKALFTFLTGTYTTDKPHFFIFKPGYCSWPSGLWAPPCKEKIRPKLEKYKGVRITDATVELPRLENSEDRAKVYEITARDLQIEYPDDPRLKKKFLKKQEEVIRQMKEEAEIVGSRKVGYFTDFLQEAQEGEK